MFVQKMSEMGLFSNNIKNCMRKYILFSTSFVWLLPILLYNTRRYNIRWPTTVAVPIHRIHMIATWRSRNYFGFDILVVVVTNSSQYCDGGTKSTKSTNAYIIFMPRTRHRTRRTLCLSAGRSWACARVLLMILLC